MTEEGEKNAVNSGVSPRETVILEVSPRESVGSKLLPDENDVQPERQSEMANNFKVKGWKCGQVYCCPTLSLHRRHEFCYSKFSYFKF